MDTDSNLLEMPISKEEFGKLYDSIKDALCELQEKNHLKFSVIGKTFILMAGELAAEIDKEAGITYSKNFQPTLHSVFTNAYDFVFKNKGKGLADFIMEREAKWN